MSERLKARQFSEDSSTVRPAQSTRLPDRGRDSVHGSETGPGSCVSIDTILTRIHALPPLPPVVVRVLQMADNEFIATRQIVSLINRDPRLSLRVIKAANAHCNGVPRTVTSVNEAVMLLGTDSFREIVLVAAARDALYRGLPGYGLSAIEMWAHSLSCGMAAEIVAEMTGYGSRTEAFIAGLLHDVGKIVLDEDMQDSGGYVHDQMIRECCSFLDAERTVLGLDHCDIGGRVMRNWGISQHIVQAVALHRKPVVSRQTVPLAGYVHLGEVLCSLAGVGLGFEGLGIALETQVLTDFKLSESSIDVALSRLVDTMNGSQALFGMPTEGSRS